MASAVAKAASGKSSVLKIVGLFKKKPGVSMEAFKDYYENKHIKLFDEHVALPGVLRYSRRYLTQIDGMASPLATTTGGYDVIMEVWYKDPELLESLKKNPNPDFTKMVVEDEEKFLDRSSMTMYLSEDCESKDGPWNI
ncbi:hypothetical protein H2200_007009 [Cladophialophora chaetospira]|uniref:EthD domain-containing protein n=1 Tax=Cladophialophora chaetospira TaxID=386627 RepID=A0AA39CGP9_9EURO|nr:hypothetical protein H2200_007009 [Cladophialophora chaetospira]